MAVSQFRGLGTFTARQVKNILLLDMHCEKTSTFSFSGVIVVALVLKHTQMISFGKKSLNPAEMKSASKLYCYHLNQMVIVSVKQPPAIQIPPGVMHTWMTS